MLFVWVVEFWSVLLTWRVKSRVSLVGKISWKLVKALGAKRWFVLPMWKWLAACSALRQKSAWQRFFLAPSLSFVVCAMRRLRIRRADSVRAAYGQHRRSAEKAIQYDVVQI